MTVLKSYYPPKVKMYGTGQESELVRTGILSNETLHWMKEHAFTNRVAWTHIDSSSGNNLGGVDYGSCVKSGEAWLQDGGDFELEIEIDPDEIGKVAWEFKCRCGTPVHFEAKVVL